MINRSKNKRLLLVVTISLLALFATGCACVDPFFTHGHHGHGGHGHGGHGHHDPYCH